MPTSKSGSSSRRGGGSTRQRGTAASASPEWEPVLRGTAGIIPGEVLLTLQPDAADAMTSSVPLHPAGVFGAAENLGVDDLDVDSLSMVEVVVAAEEKFGVSIPDDEVKNLKTVGDAVAFIERAQA